MIHSYAYRNPRVAASLGIEFATPEGVLLGFSRNISETGVSVDFGEPVLPKTAGTVRVRVGHCVVQLQAEVAHTEGFTAGLIFAFSSDRERAFVQALLEALRTEMEASRT